jgi:hypothetical protein
MFRLRLYRWKTIIRPRDTQVIIPDEMMVYLPGLMAHWAPLKDRAAVFRAAERNKKSMTVTNVVFARNLR